MAHPGYTLMEELRHIGPFLTALASPPAAIDTVADLRRHFRNRTARSVERRLARLMANPRGNECVAAPRGRRYHTSDVNINGFNALLRVLRETSAAARRLPYRQRAPRLTKGSAGAAAGAATATPPRTAAGSMAAASRASRDPWERSRASRGSAHGRRSRGSTAVPRHRRVRVIATFSGGVCRRRSRRWPTSPWRANAGVACAGFLPHAAPGKNR